MVMETKYGSYRCEKCGSIIQSGHTCDICDVHAPVTPKITSAFERIPGFQKVGPMVPGKGPITSVNLFAGRIFAIRDEKIWCLTEDKWIEIELPQGGPAT